MNIILYNPKNVNIEDVKQAANAFDAVIIECYSIDNIELKRV
jgi:hypothetical protein